MSWRDRLATGGLWLRLLAWAVLVVPGALALPVAISGPDHYRLGGLVGGLGAALGARIGKSVRDRPFLALDRTDRRAVWRIQQTAVPSGDSGLDRLAVARLEWAAKDERGMRVVAPLAALVWISAPMVAAVRGSNWWLLCAVPSAAVVLMLLVPLHDPPSRVRLERLNAALAAAPPS